DDRKAQKGVKTGVSKVRGVLVNRAAVQVNGGHQLLTEARVSREGGHVEARHSKGAPAGNKVASQSALSGVGLAQVDAVGGVVHVLDAVHHAAVQRGPTVRAGKANTPRRGD